MLEIIGFLLASSAPILAVGYVIRPILYRRPMPESQKLLAKQRDYYKARSDKLEKQNSVLRGQLEMAGFASTAMAPKVR
jgi:hypothetical protein